MSDESKQDQLKSSQYDGIREYDNDLPKWWLGTFFITVIFAFVYWAHYSSLRSGPDQAKEYELSAAYFQKALENKKPAEPEKVQLEQNTLLALLKKPEALSEGKQVFTQNCVPCHGSAGEGTIGPNLTDPYWIHGGSPEDIYRVVQEGVPEKGMISWKPVLKNSQIQSVVAYILTLEGTNPANGKAPQGDKKK